MGWFWFSLAALLCWSGSDFFSKLGCRDSSDSYSHLKMITAVGLVMGIHALSEIIGGVSISFDILLAYLPVSLLYILSMLLGYLGLRYIELSISSPICNASGALVAIFSVLLGLSQLDHPLQYIAIALSCLGVIGLGVAEATEDEALRTKRQESSNYKYAKSWLAIALPVAYCILDAAGTFADSIVLTSIDENSANVAYELTFFAAGIIALLYTVFVKKQRFTFRQEAPKYIGALFETAGQFAYIFALSDSQHVAFSAPIISSYCAVSVLWSRLFLKEKLSRKHYSAIAVTLVGIVLMGVFDM